MKEKCDIEAVLDWAYRVQCVDRRAAKAQATIRGPAAVKAINFMQERVDTSFTPPIGPIGFEDDRPDDALTIHDAVLGLDEYWIEWRAGGDFVMWTKASAAAAHQRIVSESGQTFLVDRIDGDARVRLELVGVSVLVIVHAKAGQRPEWHEGWRPSVGRPRKNKRIKRNGLHDDGGISPEEVSHARAIYAVWHAALELLAVRLEKALHKFEVIPPQAPQAPWELPERRVLRPVFAEK